MKCRERVARLEEALEITLARARAAEAERDRLVTALEGLAQETNRLAVRAANAAMSLEKFDALMHEARQA